MFAKKVVIYWMEGLMKKIILLGLLLLLVACDPTYNTISPEDAYDELGKAIFLDVRSELEYQEGHIPGSDLLPYDTISEDTLSLYPDLDQTIIVYCRSGRRSEIAAQALMELGYTKIFDMGGIVNWPYDLEK